MQLTDFKVKELAPHPWQVNVPDMTGTEWEEFLADVQENGVREPVTVSMRTGKPLIVDGRQRVRAAESVGIMTLPAIVRDFPDEMTEIEHVMRTAKLRRTLSLPQRVALAEAYEAALKADAEARQKAALKKGSAPGKPSADPAPVGTESVQTGKPDPAGKRTINDRSDKKAAEKAGVSRDALNKAKKIKASGIPNLIEAWEAEKIKTDPAYQIVTANIEIRKAVRDGTMSFDEALAAIKAVKEAGKTPEKATNDPAPAGNDPAKDEGPSKATTDDPKGGVIQFVGKNPPDDPALTEDEAKAIHAMREINRVCDLIITLDFGETRNHGEEMLINLRNHLDDLKNEVISRQKAIREELTAREEALEKGRVD